MSIPEKSPGRAGHGVRGPLRQASGRRMNTRQAACVERDAVAA